MINFIPIILKDTERRSNLSILAFPYLIIIVLNLDILDVLRADASRGVFRAKLNDTDVSWPTTIAAAQLHRYAALPVTKHSPSSRSK